MTFERTSSGQRNRATFLNVDYVCYVEGQDGLQEGDDVAFWKTAFGQIRPDIRVRFVSRGSKAVLEHLATDIIANDIDATLVAMDADYSRFFTNREIHDRRVLYTYGYSWENDVYSGNHSYLYHDKFCRAQDVSDEIIDHYKNCWISIQSGFFWGMKADFFALAKKSSVFPRDTPGRIVGKCPLGKPIPIKEQIFRLTRLARTQTQGREFIEMCGSPKNVDAHLVGKIHALISRYITNSALKIFSNQKDVSTAHFHQLSLICFGILLSSANDNVVLSHYREKLNRI